MSEPLHENREIANACLIQTKTQRDFPSVCEEGGWGVAAPSSARAMASSLVSACWARASWAESFRRVPFLVFDDLHHGVRFSQACKRSILEALAVPSNFTVGLSTLTSTSTSPSRLTCAWLSCSSIGMFCPAVLQTSSGVESPLSPLMSNLFSCCLVGKHRFIAVSSNLGAVS
jgi:hypothetical protein